MYKKIIIALLVSFSLLKASELKINLSNDVTINFPNGGTYFFYPVADINYAQLQDAIKNSSNDSARIYIFRWYQQSDIIEGAFGIKMLAYVKVTKDSIKYYFKNPEENWEIYDSAQDLVEAINEYKEYATKNKDKFYTYPNVKAFSKLKKYEQYFIMPKGMDLTITFKLSSLENESNTTGSDTNLEMPPMPDMTGNTTETSEESSAEEPPAIPEDMIDNTTESETNTTEEDTNLEMPPMPGMTDNTTETNEESSAEEPPTIPEDMIDNTTESETNTTELEMPPMPGLN